MKKLTYNQVYDNVEKIHMEIYNEEKSVFLGSDYDILIRAIVDSFNENIDDFPNDQIDSYMKIVGETIREAREKSGLYLKDLAEYMGWSVVKLSDIERGRRYIDLESLKKIKEYLKI